MLTSDELNTYLKWLFYENNGGTLYFHHWRLLEIMRA